MSAMPACRKGTFCKPSSQESSLRLQEVGQAQVHEARCCAQVALHRHVSRAATHKSRCWSQRCRGCQDELGLASWQEKKAVRRKATKALKKEKKADECRARRALAKDEKTGQCKPIPLHTCGVPDVASASASSTAAATRPPGMWRLQRFPQPSMTEPLYNDVQDERWPTQNRVQKNKLCGCLFKTVCWSVCYRRARRTPKETSLRRLCT
jgi:hypothetical protein